MSRFREDTSSNSRICMVCGEDYALHVGDESQCPSSLGKVERVIRALERIAKALERIADA